MGWRKAIWDLKLYICIQGQRSLLSWTSNETGIFSPQLGAETQIGRVLTTTVCSSQGELSFSSFRKSPIASCNLVCWLCASTLLPSWAGLGIYAAALSLATTASRPHSQRNWQLAWVYIWRSRSCYVDGVFSYRRPPPQASASPYPATPHVDSIVHAFSMFSGFLSGLFSNRRSRIPDERDSNIVQTTRKKKAHKPRLDDRC